MAMKTTRLVLERGLIAGSVAPQVDAQVSRSNTPDAVGLVEGLHLVSQLVVLVLAETLVLILARCQMATDCQVSIVDSNWSIVGLHLGFLSRLWTSSWWRQISPSRVKVEFILRCLITEILDHLIPAVFEGFTESDDLSICEYLVAGSMSTTPPGGAVATCKKRNW